MAIPKDEPAPGSQSMLPAVGQYQLLEMLGKGQFGEVWRAKAPGGVEVAVKVISQPSDRESARRELQALELVKNLRHPTLMATLAFWEHQQKVYIVVELADGTLRDRMKDVQGRGEGRHSAGRAGHVHRECRERPRLPALEERVPPGREAGQHSARRRAREGGRLRAGPGPGPAGHVGQFRRYAGLHGPGGLGREVQRRGATSTAWPSPMPNCGSAAGPSTARTSLNSCRGNSTSRPT